MRLPLVAIIGRPNTGKSTLFNRLLGFRKAIVSEIPGTTRDRIACKVETPGMDFLLVDTGGMGGGTADKEIEGDVHLQSEIALINADVILFTINSKEELTSNDFGIVDILRKNKSKHVPVIIAVTKCDNPAETNSIIPQYYGLGIAEQIIPVSSVHLLGIENLKSAITEELKKLNFAKSAEENTVSPRIAIIGKVNAGKSSLINAIMSDPQRETSSLLVSPEPGTTRDATETPVMRDGKEYVFIDTAGIRRKHKTPPRLRSGGERGLEMLAYMRAVQAVEQSDMAVIVLDSTKDISRQDKRIANLAMEEGKGIIILLNKTDLLSADQKHEALKKAKLEFSFCKFAPFLCTSAKTKADLPKLFGLIELVGVNRKRRIATKTLNEWFRDAVYGKPMGALASSKHVTQAKDVPPTFVLFVKDPKNVSLSHLKTLENNLRKTFGFEGTPVRWITKTADRR